MSILDTIIDRIQGKAPKGAKRSPQWRRVRNEFIKKNPSCAVCGSTAKLTVHHAIPFYLAPDLELSEKNLITLCENKRYGIHCHLLIGHLGNYRKFNLNVWIDAKAWFTKLKE